MSEFAVETKNLSRTYRRQKSATTGGIIKKLGRFWTRAFDEVEAVANLSFHINAGERVAFVGPNGAGKSTTIKMLAGILTPSSGTCLVAGHCPATERIKVAKSIGTVFGQRSQLWQHLPVVDSLYLLGAIYDLRRSEVRERLAELSTRFDMESLLQRTAKQLSLGERMRCELVASLLHRPKILFLDEPTIGLDVVGKAALRDVVRQMGDQEGCTILLTSHDTGDMEQVCNRVLIINEGKMIVDAPVRSIRDQYLAEKHMTVRTLAPMPDLSIAGVVMKRLGDHEMHLTVDTRKTGVQSVIADIVSKIDLADLRVEDVPMEDVIRSIYKAHQSSPIYAAGTLPPEGRSK